MKREPTPPKRKLISTFEREAHLFPYKMIGRLYELVVHMKARRRHKDVIERRARRIGRK